LWADRALGGGSGAEVLAELPRLLAADPPAGREAIIAYASGAIAAGRADQAAVTVHRFSDALRSDEQSWARAGAVLADAKSYALAAAWLSDWADRDGVTAATLLPLADSLRGLDRDADALAVAAAGVGRGGSPIAIAAFRGWLALDAALHGRTDDAGKLLAGIDRPGLPDAIRLVLALGDALVMVQQAGPDGKRAAFADAKDHLRTAAGACKPEDVPPGTARWYRRVVARLAQDTGGVAASAWAAWQRLRPWVR
jgi:cellulose synthase operon protein C